MAERPGILDARLDGLVDAFAGAMRAKLLKAQLKHPERAQEAWATNGPGTGGVPWPVWGLHHHVEKGDPLDVGAYAMFCWYHGVSTAMPLPPASPPPLPPKPEAR